MSKLHPVNPPLFQIEGADVVYIRDGRISSTERHEDLFYYDIRHADEDWSEPATIEKNVMVNFFGTLATTAPLEKLEALNPDDDYIVIKENSKLQNDILNGLC